LRGSRDLGTGERNRARPSPPPCQRTPAATADTVATHATSTVTSSTWLVHHFSRLRIRAIDDARISSTNAATRLHESLVTPNCEFSSRVAAEFARLAQVDDNDQDSFPPSVMTELQLGLDGIWAACRRVSSRENNFCEIIIFCVSLQDSRWFVPYGHNLGLTAAISNFNRMSEALCVLSRVFGASYCDHFFDDYMDISPASCSILPSNSNQQYVNSSQWFLDELHTLVGMRPDVFFINNTQALSACIHGYCHNTDMGRLCNLLHLSLAALCCQPFFNWVPSKANPADLLSRK